MAEKFRSKNIAITDLTGQNIITIDNDNQQTVKLAGSDGVTKLIIDADGEQSVKISGSDGIDQAEVDSLSKLLGTITRAHKAIHDGISYAVIHQATKASAETLIVSFKTPDTTARLHFFIKARASGEANFVFLEESVVTAGSGTEKATINRDRNSSNTSVIIDNADPATVGNITLDGTITDDGTIIFEEHFGSGKSVIGQSRGDNEFILKQNTQYAIRLTSEANGNDVELILDYYEVI